MIADQEKDYYGTTLPIYYTYQQYKIELYPQQEQLNVNPDTIATILRKWFIKIA
jgi:hypothetical protein